MTDETEAKVNREGILEQHAAFRSRFNESYSTSACASVHNSFQWQWRWESVSEQDSYVSLDVVRAEELPLVEVKGGEIAGSAISYRCPEIDGCYFGGIPFDHPPVADRRFTANQSEQYQVTSWADKGVLDCRYQRLRARAAPPMTTVDRVISEDILHVDIFTPSILTAKSTDLKKNALNPVLVWFHGGGMMAGCAHDDEFDGSNWAERGIVEEK